MINIRDALDFLERAKSSAENIERYAHDCDFGEARLVILELIAEIERLQDLIDSPPEEADWLHDDARLCGEITTGVVQIARKWHSAYRKAQNSNLMRAKEIERLRSENREIKKTDVWANDVVKEHESLREQIKAKDARIKELETACNKMTGALSEAGKRQDRLEAAFLEAKRCPTCNGEGTIHPIGQPVDSICPICLGDPESMAREALDRIKAGGKDE